jgi:hypothetical protein
MRHGGRGGKIIVKKYLSYLARCKAAQSWAGFCETKPANRAHLCEPAPNREVFA